MKENPVSLYIHIPVCVSKCKYCDFFSVPVKETPQRISLLNAYIFSLCNELKYRLNQFETSKLSTIYIGGGTPSLLNEENLSKILDTVNFYAPLKNFSEITIEANPDDITEESLKMYQKLGITRLSVGIQSMNDEVLCFCGRRANRENNLRALSLIKKYWKGKFSVDLISALPKETEESFVSGIKEVIGCNPDHISMYSLTIEEETPFGRMYESNELEYDWDFADKMWLEGKKLLNKHGYVQYEVSNFALTENECKHNLTYWNYLPYIGAGSGGTGTVFPERWTNVAKIEEYIDFWNKEKQVSKSEIPQNLEVISEETGQFEFFMMGLRKLEGVSQTDFIQKFNHDIPEKVKEAFIRWNKKGLLNIEEENKRYSLNDEGILFLNRFLEEII